MQSIGQQNVPSHGIPNFPSLGRQNFQSGMEGSFQGMANFSNLIPTAFSSDPNPASSSNVVQVGVDPAHTSLPVNIWAQQMTFLSLRPFVKGKLRKIFVGGKILYAKNRRHTKRPQILGSNIHFCC
jgi:hypothetical protein